MHRLRVSVADADAVPVAHSFYVAVAKSNALADLDAQLSLDGHAVAFAWSFAIPVAYSVRDCIPDAFSNAIPVDLPSTDVVGLPDTDSNGHTRVRFLDPELKWGRVDRPVALHSRAGDTHRWRRRRRLGR